MPDPFVPTWFGLSLAGGLLTGLTLGLLGLLRARRDYEQARQARDQEFVQLERNLTLLCKHVLPPGGPDAQRPIPAAPEPR